MDPSSWNFGTINVRDPSCFPMPLPFIQQIFAIKSWNRRKTEQSFLAPNFLGETISTFLRQIVSATYRSPFGKVYVVEFSLLMSVCEAWQWSGMQILWKVDENSLPIWSRLWTKVCVVLRRCIYSRPGLVVCNALSRLSTSCFIPKI